MSSFNKIYRKRWLQARLAHEENGTRSFPFHSDKKMAIRDPIGFLLVFLRFFLKITGLLAIGRRQAKKIDLNVNKINSSKIGIKPLRILQLSDLHLDEGNIDLELLVWKIKEAGSYHFAVITGDILTGWTSDQTILKRVSSVINMLKPEYETLFVLGNHDSYQCVEPLEKMGVKVLTNQIYELAAQDFSCGIQFIGTDDPHYFFTADAVKIMQEAQDHFYKVALVHTPELYEVASSNGIDLYLCGHTHAGQFALPGGYAPLKRVYKGKRFYKGAWNFKKMNGHTSSGLGTSAINARFFTTAEITLHEVTSGSKSS